MKRGVVVSGLALALTPSGVGAMKLVKSEGQRTPMADVVNLLTELGARIEADGKLEQSSYDKYACWCEDTLARKANDIKEGKALIEELQTLIVKLKAEVASHGAEIQQLEKDIAQNLEAQAEAKTIRDNDFEEYNGQKTENEQCIGALEAAIKALAGAGTGKFLETGLKEAELLSVVAGVRTVLERSVSVKSLSEQDLGLVRHFVQRPDDFTPKQGMSAAQVGNNPFGDYAPKSTQIQGVLKGMYDTFASDLEKANAKEAEAQKAFEALMATKIQELETLQETLKHQQQDEAQKTQTLAESKERLDATNVQLETDEKFFEETKSGCQVKATEWSERTRLRTMELNGVQQAIRILNSPEAQKTFQASTSTFLQLSSTSSKGVARKNAYKKLAGLAQRFHSMNLAELAAKVKSEGHFDKVIASIDSMIEILRAEEQADIEHRDRCQNADGKNKNDVEDLNHAIDQSQNSIEHLASEEERLGDEIEVLEAEIAKTKANMDEALAMRNAEEADFRQAMKDDADAVALLQEALATLRRFFDKNNIELGFSAKKQEPEYTVDPDKVPETSWSGGKYEGQKDESSGIVAIMEMLIEDTQNEMKTARADDAEAQQLYLKQRGTMQESLDAQMASKLATEKELADVRSQKNSMEEFKAQKEGDLGAEKELADAIYSDCSWVATHFDTRREQRKTEMDGLVEAKGYLAGVMKGDDV